MNDISKIIMLTFILILLIFTLRSIQIETMENPTIEPPEKIDIFRDQQKYLSTLSQKKGTYKQVPFPLGSFLVNSSMNTGVLRNYRINNLINTYTEELNYETMAYLLNQIRIHQDFTIDWEDDKIIAQNQLNLDYIHEGIVKKLVNLINLKYQELKLSNKYHLKDTRKYQVLKYQIIKNEPKSKENKFLRDSIFNLSFYRENKNHFFVVQVRCSYDLNQKTVSWNQIDLIGIKPEELLKFQEFLIKNQTGALLQSESEEEGLIYANPLELQKGPQTLTEYQEKFYQEDIKNYFKAMEEKEKRNEDYLKYKCFDNDGFNESTCRSYSFANQTTGTWDKPCEKNTECPFYQVNKNYPNQRGGCIQGTCEMPINIKRKGLRKFDPSIPAFCHQCDREGCVGDDCYTCCEDQLINKDGKYPHLKSPDYMFHNDGK